MNGMSVIPWEPWSGTLFRLRNLYPRSIQNTDIVSPIKFSNLGISCLMIMTLKLLGLINFFVILTLYQAMLDFTRCPHEFYMSPTDSRGGSHEF